MVLAALVAAPNGAAQLLRGHSRSDRWRDRGVVDLDRADRCQTHPDGKHCVGAHLGLDDTRRKVGGGDAQGAEVDQVLRGSGATCGIEVVDDVGAEPGGVVDEDIVTAANVNRVIAGSTDYGVGIAARTAGQVIVAGAAVDHVAAVDGGAAGQR